GHGWAASVTPVTGNAAMHPDRRSVLAALGAGLPFAPDALAAAPAPAAPPFLRIVPFEEAVRTAFRGASADAARRVAVGWCERVQTGLQGCQNDRPFAGFPAGHLRIVRAGVEPGPAVGGVRLYVATVDVVLTGGKELGGSSRPLDFATLPPAAVLVTAGAARPSTGPTPSVLPGV
ncbi:MAG: hypothetical protein ABGY75_22905, partial [Gemmataceae bacterium]